MAIRRKKYKRQKRRLARGKRALKSKGVTGSKYQANFNSKLYRKMQMVLPPRLRVEFVTELTGYIQQAMGSANKTFQIAGNAIANPFNLFALNPTYTDILNPYIDGVTSYKNWSCAGFRDLCNQDLYQKYRVISSMIEFTLIPTNYADVIEVGVAPIPQTNAGVATVYGTYTTLAQSPLAKTMMTGPGIGGGKACKIVNKCSTAKAYGVHSMVPVIEDGYVADWRSTNGGGGALPNNTFLWQIWCHASDNIDNTAFVPFKVKIHYNTELFGQTLLGYLDHF